MQIHKTEQHACPRCKHRINCQSGDFGPPQPGDLAICLYCGAPLQMGDSLELKLLSEAERKQLPAEARAALIAAEARALAARAGHPDGYADCARRMALGARRYIEAQGREGLLFTLPPEGVAVIGSLAGELLNALGANEKSREFLREMDNASLREATIAMAVAVIEAAGLPTTEATAVSPWAFLFQQRGEPS